MLRSLRILLFFLLLIIGVEIAILAGLGSKKVATLIQCSDGGTILQGDIPNCDWEIVPFQSPALFIKTNVTNLSKKNEWYYSSFLFSSNLSLDIPLQILLSNERQGDITFCIKPLDTPDVRFRCYYHKPLSQIANQIQNKKVLLRFELSDNSNNCNYANKNLSSLLTSQGNLLKLIQLFFDNKCKPNASQLYLL